MCLLESPLAFAHRMRSVIVLPGLRLLLSGLGLLRQGLELELEPARQM